MIANLNALDREESFDRLSFPDEDERIVTRLGEEGLVLRLDEQVTGPFGHNISRIAVPARWSRGLKGDLAVNVESDKKGLVLTVDDHSFCYSRVGLDIIA